MAPARFSAFELLLLKSRYQPDTASLLLLAWVFVNKRVALAEDRRYLEVLANGYRHSPDLDTLLAVASADLSAIQLAAEVLLRERVDAQSHPFLRRAIGLATSDGDPSLRNHYILRFLADLSGVTPDEFARLFREVTGRALMAPGDPSRHVYWQDKATEAPDAAAGDAATRKQPAWQRWRRRVLSARSRRRRQRREREQLRQQARQQREEMLRQARQREEARRRDQARREQAQRREEARRQEQARREDSQRQEEARRRQRAHQERTHQRERTRQQTAGERPPHYRVRLALQVLELDESASRIEIKRAYRRLAQRHHPDRFHGQGDLRVALASQRFQRIKNAYDYLMTTV